MYHHSGSSRRMPRRSRSWQTPWPGSNDGCSA
jgi:hypothetical protein